MRISASTIPRTNRIHSRAPLKPSHQSGFTLLEVLVVVVLMVMISTLLISAALRGSNADPAATAAERFVDTMTLMSENSLFRGELLALRLTESGWQPLGFHVGEAEFVPLAKPLTETKLENDVRLEWLVEQTERAGERVQIADVGANLISDELMSGWWESNREAAASGFHFSGNLSRRYRAGLCHYFISKHYRCGRGGSWSLK